MKPIVLIRVPAYDKLANEIIKKMHSKTSDQVARMRFIKKPRMKVP